MANQIQPQQALEQARFARLFHGRIDVYGHDEGRCVSGTPDYVRHLLDIEPIGVYPLMPDLRVAWGCVDIDFDDWQLAENLRLALDVLGIRGWIETSRSKGFHVWVFARDFTPAPLMRGALMAACQVIDYKPKEVNPKQTTTEQLSKGYGNYVRLPYPGGMVGSSNPRRRVLNGNGSSMSWDLFTNTAWHHRAMHADLKAAADLYVPPAPPVAIVRNTEATADRSSLNALGKHVLMHGPLEGQDRSTALMVLAHQCAESDLSKALAWNIVSEGDARWGKFYARGDHDQRIDEIVRRAYGG